MKLILLFVCAVLAHVNAQCGCGCGCSKPAPCRPLPPRPLSPCSRPLPPCPRPLPPCPRPSPPPRTCPPPIVIDCPPSYEVLTPTVEVAPVVALPSCNCPTIPSLPVSPQILPGIQAPPFLSNLGCISPCLGGLPDFSLYPLGMINPFLPAASPVSALAPTVSSLYPPINPCNCGCKYLKKIPIPPPCL